MANEKTIDEILKDNKILLASTSEPYAHYYHGGEIHCRGTAGGVPTAFDSLLKKYGGTWVALGLGTADKEVVDSKNKVNVPPGENKYLLKRVWLSKKEEESGLALASNSMLWPLSHVVHVRPHFQEDAWEQYKIMNKKMAESLAQEITDNTIVWINDYQLSLCAAYLKKLKPTVKTGFFWHIPWPGFEAFKIFPWKKELLESLLQNDLIGFHTNEYTKNFLYTAQKLVDCKVNEREVIVKENSKCIVKTLPIGIDYEGVSQQVRSVSDDDVRKIRKRYQALDRKLLVAADRMDYTKGISEKIKALDYLFTSKPGYVNKITLVQIAAPTRTNLPEYKKALEDTLAATDAVNWKYSIGDWKPVILINDFVPLKEIIALYRAADTCLVTSLHDGMNLVAKEFIASNDGNGMLVLSQFAGASEELEQAVQVNPFLIENIAEGIEQALEMPEVEKKQRMNKMKKTVAQNTVFNWADNFIKTLVIQ
ncbi:MAG: trehalose-6-phosphate synthase [Candidatus Micrarchaeota archaeon]